MKNFRASVLSITLFSACLSGCAVTRMLTEKKLPPKNVYPASYQASSDGHIFLTQLQLFDLAEKAKTICQSIDSSRPVKAHYTVSKTDQGIQINVKTCESESKDNCTKLKSCLTQRPVAWMARASGRNSNLNGIVYTDWLGRCGGEIAVNFLYSNRAVLPIERVGCAEPQQTDVDASQDLFMIPVVDVQSLPSAAAYIENLLVKWNTQVFRD